MTLDAACASSLYALKLACETLRDNRADIVLAGGTSRADQLYTQMASPAQSHEPSGNCAPFTAAGDGLLVGELGGICRKPWPMPRPQVMRFSR